MIDYLQKFNNLPKELRDKVASKKVMDIIHDLESKYSVGLAAVVMKVMVKNLRVDELENYFSYDKGLDKTEAKKLTSELNKQVFSKISNYLEYINEEKEDGATTKKVDESKNEKRKNSDFYFSIEDEEEVRQNAQDFSKFDRREVQNIQVEQKIDSIVSQVGMIFSSEEMMARLKQVLKTYLRGVRNKIDTKLALERGIEMGGLGLDADISDDMLKIVDLINKEEAQKPKTAKKPKAFAVPEDGDKSAVAQTSVGDVPYEFKIKSDDQPETAKKVEAEGAVLTPALHKVSDEKLEGFEDEYASEEEKKASAPEDIELKEKPNGDFILDLSKDEGEHEESEKSSEEKEKKSEEAKMEPVLRIINDDEKQDQQDDKNTVAKDVQVEAQKQEPKDEKNDKKEKSRKKKSEFEIPKSAMARSAKASDIKFPKTNANTSVDSGKVKMEDIKQVAKLGGPIEELASMSLDDFRRIGENANESIDRVKQLFLLLEDDGFNKKMMGVKAWRKSPVNRLYLKIGQDSIVHKKDIASVIKENEDAARETLSQAEFDLIMNLNKEIRY